MKIVLDNGEERELTAQEMRRLLGQGAKVFDDVAEKIYLGLIALLIAVLVICPLATCLAAVYFLAEAAVKIWG